MRGPFARPRVSVSYDPESGLTRQSFKDECDINRIVGQYVRTGILPPVRGEPEYGDAPEATLFEAACAQAAIRTAEEDGFEYPSETASEAPESTNVEKAGEPLPEKGAPEGASDAAEGESGGE